MLHFRAILHATDLSPCSMPAFHLACGLARQHNARLILLHVYPPPVCHGEEVARRQDKGYFAELWTQLHTLKPPLEQQVDYLLEEGDPAEMICRVATDHSCDLIVLGTHGRSGLGRALMGSVAEKVLRLASCPVLTMRIGLSTGERVTPAGKVSSQFA